MAYVPDEAIYDSFEISKDAFRVYCLLCLRRNRRSELSYVSIEHLQAVLALSRGQAYKTLAELRENGWTAGKLPKLTCQKGDFGPVIQTVVTQSPVGDKKSPVGDKKSPVGDSHIRIYQPIIPANNTRTPRSRGGDAWMQQDARVSTEEFASTICCKACNDTGIAGFDGIRTTPCDCTAGDQWANALRDSAT
jgi:hypothetical protein